MASTWWRYPPHIAPILADAPEPSRSPAWKSSEYPDRRHVANGERCCRQSSGTWSAGPRCSLGSISDRSHSECIRRSKRRIPGPVPGQIQHLMMTPQPSKTEGMPGFHAEFSKRYVKSIDFRPCTGVWERDRRCRHPTLITWMRHRHVCEKLTQRRPAQYTLPRSALNGSRFWKCQLKCNAKVICLTCNYQVNGGSSFIQRGTAG